MAIPPTTGQALVATDATHATWQTVAGSIAGAPAGTLGGASYSYLIQSPNDSVAPGVSFTVSTEVYNGIPSAIVMSAANGGTVWTLATGTYVIDYEMSMSSTGPVAIFTGPSSGALARDDNTISGSTTATTWVHGRAFETVTAGVNNVVSICATVSTATVVLSGTASPHYNIRVSFLKIA